MRDALINKMKEFDPDNYLQYFMSEKPFFFWHGQSTVGRASYGGDENADRIAIDNGGITMRIM